MNIEDKLESLLLKAKKEKKINLLEIDKLELDENQIEYVINFLADNDIKDINDESLFYKGDSVATFYTSDSVAMYLKEISIYKVLTPEEQKKLFILYNQGDLEAKKKIIESNLKLVIKPARRYYNILDKKPSIDFLDLIQAGNIGLIKAVEKFDCNKTYRFSTYAMWWIRQNIARFVTDNKYLIRVPIHMQEITRKIRDFENQFLSQNKRMPVLEEYISNIDERKENIILALETERDVLSLDFKNGDDTESFENFVDISPNEFDDAENRIVVNSILNIGKKYLTDVELKIVILRYGLNNNKMYTLEEIGKMFGLTRERIRQKEQRALRILRHALKCNEYFYKIKELKK